MTLHQIRCGIGVVLVFLMSLCAPPAVAAQTPGLRIVVLAGEDAVNIIQQKTAVAPVVEVHDRNDQPVAGAVVRFAIRGSRASFNGARSLSVTTNVTGRAAVTGLTPSSAGSFQITVSASFQGQTAAATIAQANVMTVAQSAQAAGAAGSGAGGGGGISATTLVVIGGVAAGGALVATKVVPLLAGNTTYSAHFSMNTLATDTRTLNGQVIVSCTWTRAFDGTLTVELDGRGDGSHTGNFKAEWTEQEIARTCPNPNPTGGGGSTISGDLTGPTGTIQFTRENRETASGGALFDWVAVMAFSGTLSGDVITGAWTISSVSTQVVFSRPGEADVSGYPPTSVQVTLTKQ